ncbi:MAG: phosphonatase-like hydrolase [Lewinellaceae bacterium]|nr:phosphonatase-like hydrolase [Saprospiraceae bacterium]MCB9340015.1 phosphonatase-like hydrolase [Lewinellaceae bacterium]
MTNIQLVVFDMAGTTIDEDNLVYKTVQRAIERTGHPVPLEKVLLLAAGKEKLQAISDVLKAVAGPEQAEELALLAFEDFKGLLADAYAKNTAKPMPGAAEVFRQLHEKGIKVVLNTGYSREVADGLLRQIGWDENPLIDATITASDVRRSRPHPDMVHLAMKKCGVADASAVAKIGDSIIDIEEGLNAGCGLVAGITTGAQTANQLMTAKPTHVFESLEELLQWVV